MADVPDPERQREIVMEVLRRLRSASIAANLAGATVVFLFLSFVLPEPGLKHPWVLIGVNGGLFVLSMAVGLPLATVVLKRMWQARVRWALEGREPTPRERELTLRFPLTQHQLVAGLWVLDAVVFGAFNLAFSAQLAFNVAITVVLGGLVMVALGYLLAERLLRPLAVLALASGAPSRPQLPGVAARALLSWTLGTGVILLALVLVGGGTLIIGKFSLRQLAVVVLVLALVGLAVGLTLTIGLAGSLAGRIEALRTAVGRVEQGDFDHDVTVDDGSEMGLLQSGFNRMVAGLRERERLRDLFGRQVGEDVVRHALEHGVALGGEAREAAVLFVDLKASTRLAQEADPTEVVAKLNAFFAVVVEVVAAHGGWVNKFEGDAALCIFGAPLEDSACVDKALAAGRELAGRLPEQLPEVRAGIGISAGRVVAGNVGAARRFEYTVIGDAVNEAARLSELAKEAPEVALASGAALARAGDAEGARWRTDRSVRLRGRAEPTDVVVPCEAGSSAAEPQRTAGAAG